MFLFVLLKYALLWKYPSYLDIFSSNNISIRTFLLWTTFGRSLEELGNQVWEKKQKMWIQFSFCHMKKAKITLLSSRLTLFGWNCSKKFLKYKASMATISVHLLRHSSLKGASTALELPFVIIKTETQSRKYLHLSESCDRLYWPKFYGCNVELRVKAARSYFALTVE